MEPSEERRESLPAIPPQNKNFNIEPMNDKDTTKKEKYHSHTDEPSKKYARIRTDYYKKSWHLTSKGDKVPELSIWNKATIKEDHEDLSIFKKIEKFENFANVPDNNPLTYKRNIQGCYNLYEPIKHLPVEGNYDNTNDFLKHLFGDKIDIAIDWLTLLYKQPTQMLPAICLVSKENRTGKTTFLRWLCKIYDSNSIILGNEDLSSNFNSSWATKLIIGVDETVIEKNLVKEKIKRLVTDDEILVERKGIDKNSVPFVGKFILLSNNESNFIKFDKEDTRFFVSKVPVVKIMDANLETKLTNEIPAFLHFLINRKLSYPEKLDRLWFKPEDFETPALLNIIQSSRSRTEMELRDWLEGVFNADYELGSILITISHLKKQLSKEVKYQGLRNELEKILKEDWGLIPEKQQRFRSPYLDEGYNVDRNNDKTQAEKKIYLGYIDQNGTPYRIKRELIF